MAKMEKNCKPCLSMSGKLFNCHGHYSTRERDRIAHV